MLSVVSLSQAVSLIVGSTVHDNNNFSPTFTFMLGRLMLSSVSITFSLVEKDKGRRWGAVLAEDGVVLLLLLFATRRP